MEPTRNGLAHANLARLGIVMPPVRPAAGNYRRAMLCHDLLYLSGQGPADAEGRLRTGKVGLSLTVDEGYEDARLVGINLLSTMQSTLGSLDRVLGIVKMLGMVNCVLDFEQHPEVINGCSDLLVAVFGEEVGGHARSAVGVGSLPRQISVEIELIVRVAV